MCHTLFYYIYETQETTSAQFCIKLRCSLSDTAKSKLVTRFFAIFYMHTAHQDHTVYAWTYA